MAQDLLQISLEHHRAGRLTRAEAGYRQVLADNGENAEALHWLGVLYTQAEQWVDAIALLEKAAALVPGDLAYQHNLAQAYLAAGRVDDAIGAMERAVLANPAVQESKVLLARLRLRRRSAGDAEAAVDLLRQAQSAGTDTVDLHRSMGVALLATGKPKDSIISFRSSLAKKADDATALYYLGLAHRAVGELKETRKSLNKALEIDPAYASAWCALALLDAQAGNWAAAAGLYRRAIASKRDYLEAHRGLAMALRAAGNHDEARAAAQKADLIVSGKGAVASKPGVESKSNSPQGDTNTARERAGDTGKGKTEPDSTASVAALEKHLTPTEDDKQAHFALSALLNVFPPTTIPDGTLVGLFDRYAPKFDHHLVDRLEYRVPEQLAQALRETWTGKPLDILDLGCGTGLCGPLLRPLAATLGGVDLSPAMIEKARERGVYDHLEVAELVQALQKYRRDYDLLIATDVFIYVGDLSAVFEAAVGALRPGGMLAFSVEAGSGERYELGQRSRRYLHSKPYLAHLAKIYGFEELRFDAIEVRKDADRSVDGYLVVLRVAA